MRPPSESWLRLASLCLIIISHSLSPATNAQEPSEEQRQRDLHDVAMQTKKAIELIRPALFDGLTGEELTVYRRVVFRVTENDSLSRAWSGRDENGQRVVTIDVGYARQIYAMAQALMIEQVENKPALIPYIRYVLQSWQNHSSFIKLPPEFVGFDFDKIMNDPNQALAFGKMNASAMAFIMAHEVGHHVLGHYNNPPPNDLAKLRQLEEDADRWALKCLESAHPHFSPLSGVLPLIFGYYVTANPISVEQTTGHPADLRRIHLLFQEMKNALPAYREDIERDGKPQGINYYQFKDFVERSLAEYEQQLATNSSPVAPYSKDAEGPFAQPANSKPARPQPVMTGGYCGDVYGRRFCAMPVQAPIGQACGCPGMPGWGMVVR